MQKAARGIQVEVTRPSFPWINNYAIFANCLLFPARVSPTRVSLDAERSAYQCRSRLSLSGCFGWRRRLRRNKTPRVDKHRRQRAANDPQTVVNFQQPRVPRVSVSRDRINRHIAWEQPPSARGRNSRLLAEP